MPQLDALKNLVFHTSQLFEDGVARRPTKEQLENIRKGQLFHYGRLSTFQQHILKRRIVNATDQATYDVQLGREASYNVFDDTAWRDITVLTALMEVGKSSFYYLFLGRPTKRNLLKQWREPPEWAELRELRIDGASIVLQAADRLYYRRSLTGRQTDRAVVVGGRYAGPAYFIDRQLDPRDFL